MKINNYTEMEYQLIAVVKNFSTASTNFIGSIYGKLTALMGFFAAVGLTDIAPLIHIALGFVAVDMIFGLLVTIKLKGWKHILSARLRDSLVKAFFYILIIIGLFLIEKNLIDGYALTAKLAFALICGTELWSILANMLIILPNIPVLRMLKSLLEQEIAKKTGQSIEEVKKDLEDGEFNN